VSIWSKLRALPRLQRITLILFVIVVVNVILDATTGYQILGGDILNVLFCIALLILVLRMFRPLTRKILWRLRNRLLVTYVFLGVVPLGLITIMLLLGSFVFFGQIAANLVRGELDRRIELNYSAAHDLALSTLYGARAAEFVQDLRQRLPQLRTIVQTETSSTVMPREGELQTIPSWSTPGFKGVIIANNQLMIAADAQAQSANRAARVFAYLPIDSALLNEFPADLGYVNILSGNLRTTAVSVRVNDTDKANPNVEPGWSAIAKTGRPLPPAQGIWDWTLSWVSILDAKELEGRTRNTILTVNSRPSLLMPRIFSNLGTGARVPGILLLIVAGFFLVVEIVSLIVSLRLTRTITRTVHDLYLGTKQVAAGNFSKRIPIRKTQDQLSELAGSFNTMTDHIQLLLEEVREKEKLESELEIAREVQKQLFPKGVPHLKTLQLAGVCNPARIVSGDYYDFVPVGAQRTAIVIGDISGKGISAALLMASVQSSLHAQLSVLEAIPSTATLVTRLNKQLYENTPPEKYATFYCAFYDDSNGRLSYTNAGHLPPILVRNGNASRLEVNGMVVGLMPDAAYDQLMIELQPGDLLAAFTDGITESENGDGEQFGEDRLARLLVEHSRKTLDEIVEITTSSVRQWAFDLDNQDDTTMLLARRV